MIEKIKALVVKYQDMILYVFFGALATLVNTVSYYLCYNVFGISNVPSVIIAWLMAVVFAFFTNKLWVFKSKSFAPEVLKHEIPTFSERASLPGCWTWASCTWPWTCSTATVPSGS